MVDARDYRIICILEVYSQNKLEDDFLENLAVLTNVIKNQIEEEEKEINDNSMEENFAVGEVNNEEDQIQNDSFTLNVQDAVTKGFMNADSANWSIE